jgi:hypothetical protein
LSIDDVCLATPFVFRFFDGCSTAAAAAAAGGAAATSLEAEYHLLVS